MRYSKITKQILQRNFGNTDLERFVLRDILEDSKGYNGSFIERVKARLEDVNHGCQTGVIGKLIYHSDCKKFFIRFLDDISDFVIDLEGNIGSAVENKQGLPIYTFYAWLAYEEVAYNIYNFIDEQSA